MDVLLLVIVFLQTVLHACSRPDYTLDDPKTRFSKSTNDKYSINLLNIDDGSIIFPQDETVANRFSGPIFTLPKIKPHTCEGGICEDVDDYPSDFVNDIVRKSKGFETYFTNQVEEDASFDVSDRISGPQPEIYETLCTSIAKPRKPRSAQLLNGTYILIVNTDMFDQTIYTDICDKNNLKCKLHESFPNKVESICKQKYIHQRLVAFNTTATYYETFQIPSCCVCHIKKTENKFPGL